MLYLAKFIRAGNAKAQVKQVVAGVSMDDDPMMPTVHAQIVAIRRLGFGEFHAHHQGGKLFPFVRVLHPDSHIAEFGQPRHFSLLRLDALCTGWHAGLSLTHEAPSRAVAILVYRTASHAGQSKNHLAFAAFTATHLDLASDSRRSMPC